MSKRLLACVPENVVEAVSEDLAARREVSTCSLDIVRGGRRSAMALWHISSSSVI